MNDNTINFDETMPPGRGRDGEANGLKPGDMLGQYKVVQLLGRGGMGEVYEVEHTTLEKRYALKLLPADFANRSDALERFKREARVMARLEHPNIVQVDEFGETDGRYWLRMELATGGEVGGRRSEVRSPKSEVGGPKSEGGDQRAEVGDQRAEVGDRRAEVRTLADYAAAQDGRLDPDEAAAVFAQILDGLAYAHERGTVHRDLKPGNILIFMDENSSFIPHPSSLRFKIADFGLVRLVGEEWVRSQAELSVKMSMSIGGMQTELPEGAGTSTKSMLGTFEYMSPEQKDGKEASAASDIYSVGMMMFRLLTGRKQPGFKPPSKLVDGLNPAWDDLILTALEEDATDRFANAAAMRENLPSEMEGETPSSRPVQPQPTPPPAPKSPPPEHQRFQPPSPRVNEPPTAPESPPNPAAETRRAAPEPRKKKSGGKKMAVLVLLALALVGGGAYLLYQQGQYEAPARLSDSYEIASAPDTSSQKRATSEPESRETDGPVPGEDWRSPATGMEFVWVPKLNCWVGKYEVTNGEYRKKERGHSSEEYKGHSFNGDRQPVVYVNYSDAQAYATWLTQRDREVLGGARYRLPTKDEFTTFARCDDGREYPWGDNWPPKSGQAGNYDGEECDISSGEIDGYRDGHVVTCDVEKSWKNPWGLYGVGGNVWECTSASPGGNFDAWRGASWSGDARGPLRCSGRGGLYASPRSNDDGFRLLLSH